MPLHTASRSGLNCKHCQPQYVSHDHQIMMNSDSPCTSSKSSCGLQQHEQHLALVSRVNATIQVDA